MDEDTGDAREEIVILNLIENIVSELGNGHDFELDADRFVGETEVVLDHQIRKVGDVDGGGNHVGLIVGHTIVGVTVAEINDFFEFDLVDAQMKSNFIFDLFGEVDNLVLEYMKVKPTDTVINGIAGRKFVRVGDNEMSDFTVSLKKNDNTHAWIATSFPRAVLEGKDLIGDGGANFENRHDHKMTVTKLDHFEDI